ncbi:MAG: hypothetical protein JJW00_08605 [Sulfurimonas sp.]|nr:hypothetical protein [Sulfurimonas sp.]
MRFVDPKNDIAFKKILDFRDSKLMQVCKRVSETEATCKEWIKEKNMHTLRLRQRDHIDYNKLKKKGY